MQCKWKTGYYANPQKAFAYDECSINPKSYENNLWKAQIEQKCRKNPVFIRTHHNIKEKSNDVNC